jgi:hypothetical protein
VDQKDRGGIKQTAYALDDIGRSFCGSSLGVRPTGAWPYSQHSGWNVAVHRLIICRQDGWALTRPAGPYGTARCPTEDR